MASLDEWLRRILAYATLYGFLFFMFLHGVAQSFSGFPFRKGDGLKSSPIPDFSRYGFMRNLSAEEFPIDDPTRRVIVTGDLHGMIKPLENLLHDLNYSSTKDVFIHVGDVVTKGPHNDSMTLLTYLATHNITGVRGNNDQKVVEWRGWLNWITSLSGGEDWLNRLEKMLRDTDTDEHKLIKWMHDQRNAASKDDKKWWKLLPDKWVLFGDHYRVARDMSAKEFQYLLDLPLCLYVPSAHVFIVHAGLLPSDPEYPYYDKRQPLARMPELLGPNVDASEPSGTSNELEKLRTLQDLSLLTLIPQNSIPWVILNIRSVRKGKVSKKIKGEGNTPWSDLWKQEMKRCMGYKQELLHDTVDGDGKGMFGSKKDSQHAMPCYPSTVVYGHAAKRGLDLKRWSIGLDSGCVYGKKLSALVIGGPENKPPQQASDVGVIENHNGDDMKQGASFLFSDHARARITTVKCQR